MNTTRFLLSFWHPDIMAILVIIVLIAFHYITNKYRFSRKSPLFFSAVILFILVTLSPLDFLSKYYLFSAHMAQHIILLLIIPPLILTGTDKDFLEKVFRTGFGSWQFPLLSLGCMVIRSRIYVDNAFTGFDDANEQLNILYGYPDDNTTCSGMDFYLAGFLTDKLQEIRTSAEFDVSFSGLHRVYCIGNPDNFCSCRHVYRRNAIDQ